MPRGKSYAVVRMLSAGLLTSERDRTVNVDRRAIEPFNVWWRSFNHCEPSPQAIAAFNAGFKAGLQRAVEEAHAIINGKPVPAVGKSGL